MNISKRETIFRALAAGPGFSEEIAADTGMPVRTVSATLTTLWELGRILRSDERVSRKGLPSAYIYSRRTKAWRPWTVRDVQALKAMHGKTAEAAARALGRTEPSVRNQARRCGVTLKSRAQTVWPVKVRMQAEALRAQGKTYDEVSALLGVPLGTVRQWGRKMSSSLSTPAAETRTTPNLPYHPPSEDNT